MSFTAATGGPEILRRGLLGLMTALIVARPLVLGEDPGLLERLSTASSLTLTLLWMAAALGWAVWRAWTRQATWYGSLVEPLLLLVVVLVFTSAGLAARYKHPAWLISWEWLVLLMMFCLVRQLARTEGDNRRLLAAVVASGISLSAYAVYQCTIEFPQQRAEFLGDRDRLRQAIEQMEGVVLAPDDPQVQLFAERLQNSYVFATFAHPNSFAGFLVLLLPAAIGWGLASWRLPVSGTMKVLVTGGALLMLAALLLTQSRGGILAALLVGAAVAGVRGRHWLWARRIGAGAGLAALVGTGFLVYQQGWGREGLAKATRSFQLRVDYWTATWDMIRAHPWLGVGPGNFSRYYPRYMLPTAFEQIKDPHNFLLEMWATCGLAAMAALFVCLAAFFWMTRHSWTDTQDETGEGDQDVETRWEFYLGGMAGLLLGFALWASSQTGILVGDQIILGGVVSGIRAMIWFAAFAVLESVPWTGPTRALALTAGVAALLLNLLVSGGIGLPSVAQPLWFMAALALNSMPEPSAGWTPRYRLLAYLPVPLLAVTGLVYFAFVYYPVSTCSRALHAAHLEADRYYNELRRAEAVLMPEEKTEAVKKAIKLYHLIRNKLKEEAIKSDPDDVRPVIEFGRWYEEGIKLDPTVGADLNLERLLKKTRAIDPEGTESYLIEARLHSLFGQRTTANRKAEYQIAADAMKQVVERDPTSARDRYEWAELLSRLGEVEATRREAAKALELDQLSREPSRQLTPTQRAKVHEWLGLSPP